VLLLLTGMIFTAFISCKDKKDAPYQIDTSSSKYYPLAVNKYVVYDVDSLIWVDSTCDTIQTRYQIRYEIVDSFRDEQNRRSYRIETATRTDSAGWVPGAVYYVTPAANGVEYAEKGLQFIKLSYPIEEGRTWEGNALIPAHVDADLTYLAGWKYRYERVAAPYRSEIRGYDTTVTVIQVDQKEGDPKNTEEYSSRMYGKEIYAYDVGLVFREFIRWSYDPATGCRKGYHMVMREVAHN
jgi:hypothetical protein